MESSQILSLDGLTPNQKSIFQMEYKEKSVGTAYLLWFFLGAHKAYLDSWGKQILYWITIGGLLIWMFADLFRMKTLVKRRNAKLFEEALMKAKLVS